MQQLKYSRQPQDQRSILNILQTSTDWSPQLLLLGFQKTFSISLTPFVFPGYVGQAGERNGRESGGSSRAEPRQLHSLEVIIALKPRQSKLI